MHPNKYNKETIYDGFFPSKREKKKRENERDIYMFLKKFGISLQEIIFHP